MKHARKNNYKKLKEFSYKKETWIIATNQLND